MDRREPAPIVDPATESIGPARSGLGFVAASIARRSIRRSPALLAAGSALTIVLGAFVVWFWLSAVARHRTSPARTCRFRDIALDPGLPGWIGTNRETLLERLRRDSGIEDQIHVLNPAEIDAVRLAFETRFPWSRTVREIRVSYPNLLTVSLDYREPVAYVPIRDSPSLMLDGEGVVLPSDDLNARSPSIDRLIQLTFPANLDPVVARPGVALAVRDRPEGRPSTEPASAFAGLAAELHRRGPIGDRLRFRAIQREKDVFWVQLDDGVDAAWTFLRWGRGPHPEHPGEPSSAEKFAFLTDWAAHHKLSEARSPAFLRFSAGGVEIKR